MKGSLINDWTDKQFSLYTGFQSCISFLGKIIASEANEWMYFKFCLMGQISFNTYQNIDAKALFEFKLPHIPFTHSSFTPDRPIELELILKPDLLPRLLEHASTAEEAASYLMQLSQEQEHKSEDEEIDPLLLTENWFALSVTQTLEFGKTIGYRTLWSYLPPSALANGMADPDQVTEGITEFFSDLMEQNLDTMAQEIATESIDAFSNFFKELTDAFSDEDERKPRTPVFDALINFFQKDNWSFLRIQGEPALSLAFAGQNGQWNCYARAREDQRQILFYSICPIPVPEEKRSSIAEFLTRANYGMILGNFELDFSDGEVRYKTSLNSANSIPSQSAIQQLVYTNLMIMDEYLPGIRAVIETGQSPHEAIRAIETKAVPEAVST